MNNCYFEADAVMKKVVNYCVNKSRNYPANTRENWNVEKITEWEKVMRGLIGDRAYIESRRRYLAGGEEND